MTSLNICESILSPHYTKKTGNTPQSTTHWCKHLVTTPKINKILLQRHIPWTVLSPALWMDRPGTQKSVQSSWTEEPNLSRCTVYCGNAGSGDSHTTVRSNRGNRITAVHLASSQHTPQAINNTSIANTVDLLIPSLFRDSLVRSRNQRKTNSYDLF